VLPFVFDSFESLTIPYYITVTSRFFFYLDTYLVSQIKQKRTIKIVLPVAKLFDIFQVSNHHLVVAICLTRILDFSVRYVHRIAGIHT
jgi:hypothetical protein